MLTPRRTEATQHVSGSPGGRRPSSHGEGLATCRPASSERLLPGGRPAAGHSGRSHEHVVPAAGPRPQAGHGSRGGWGEAARGGQPGTSPPRASSMCSPPLIYLEGKVRTQRVVTHRECRRRPLDSPQRCVGDRNERHVFSVRPGGLDVWDEAVTGATLPLGVTAWGAVRPRLLPSFAGSLAYGCLAPIPT